jgi:hypothetical protein
LKIIIARNVTMEGCGALRDCRYLLHDRDTKYTQSFRAIIASGRVEPLVLPARSPNLNAYAERAGSGRSQSIAHRDRKWRVSLLITWLKNPAGRTGRDQMASVSPGPCPGAIITCKHER